MKLDKSKKYEFCGEVYSWDGCVWLGIRAWNASAFQFFADYGHVTEIREPLVFEGRVMIDDDDTWGSSFGIVEWRDIPESDRKGKTFKVTWTEVVK